MTRTLTLAMLGLSALPALAQTAETAPAPQTAALQVAIEENGCRVTSENNASILQAAGLAEADAATVVQALLDSGLAVIDGGALVLISEKCP